MRKMIGIILFILLFSPCFALNEPLTILGVVQKLLEHDPEIRISMESLRLAETNYRKSLADGAPSFKLTDTGYSLYKSRFQATNTFNLGLGYSQKIPTSGTLSVTVENGISVRSEEGKDQNTYSQTPSFSLTWSQPFLLNGKLIDTEAFAAGQRKAEIDKFRAKEDNSLSMNSGIVAAISNFFDVINLRKTISYQENRLAWERMDLVYLEEKLRLKLTTETAVWEKKLTIGDLEETLYGLKLDLTKSGNTLTHSLGIENLADYVLDESLPAYEQSVTDGELSRRVMSANPSVVKEILALEKARLETITSDVSFAPTLSTSFSFEPSYPTSLPWADAVPKSISNFWHKDADYDLILSFLFTIPIDDGGKRSLTRDAGRSSEATASQTLIMRKALTLRDLQFNLLKRENIKEKISLLMDYVELRRKQLDNQKKLYEFKQITEHALSFAELDLENQQNRLWRARADLLSANLELTSMTGESLAAQFAR